MNNNLTIVMYHYIRNLKDTRYPGIKGLDVELFEEQILYLKKNYSIISLEELIVCLNNKKVLPQNAALLTFDDGYKDHYTYAFPILMKYNLTGVFYIPTKSFKEKKVLDVNKIHFILASQLKPKELVQDLFGLLDVNREKYKLKSNEEYFREFAQPSRFDTKEVIFIKRLLQVVLPDALRSHIIDNLFDKYVGVDEKAFWEELYLTKEQIQCMQKCGMYFGSHSHEHCWLNALSKEEQRKQVELSLEYLKEVGVNIEKWTMCYPYGAYNKDTLEILEEKGCQLAVTTEVDVAVISEENRLIMPRLDTNDLPKDRSAIYRWNCIKR